MVNSFNLAGRVWDRSLRRASLLLLVAAMLVFSVRGGQLLSGQLAENYGSLRVTMAPSVAPEPAQPVSYATLPTATVQSPVARLQRDGSNVTGVGRPATGPISHVGPFRGPKGRLIAGLLLLQALHMRHGD